MHRAPSAQEAPARFRRSAITSFLRRFGWGLLLTVGLVLVAAASLATFFRSTFVDQESFVETFDAVVTQDALVERVVESFNDDFENMSAEAVEDGRINVDLIDFEALGIPTLDGDGDEIEPEQLIEALRDLQRSTVRDAVDAAVDRPDFPEAFTAALVSSHDQFLAALDLDLTDREPLPSDGEFFLSLEDTYDDVLRRLAADPATSDVVAVGSESLGTLKIGDRTTTSPRLWGFGRYARDSAALLVLGAVACLAASVLIAERRPRALISAGIGVIFVAGITLVVMYGLWAVVPLLTEGRTSGDLVATVYEHALRPLLRQQSLLAVGGLALAAVGWLTRWIWPDDWVYSYYDDGSGIKSVARRATRAERVGRRPQGPVPVHAAPVAQGWPQQQPQAMPQTGWQQPPPQPGYPQPMGWGVPTNQYGQAPYPAPPQEWPYLPAPPPQNLPPAAPQQNVNAPDPIQQGPQRTPEWDPSETRAWDAASDGAWATEAPGANGGNGSGRTEPPALPAATDWSATQDEGWSEPLFGEERDPAGAPTMPVPEVGVAEALAEDEGLSEEPATGWDYGGDW